MIYDLNETIICLPTYKTCDLSETKHPVDDKLLIINFLQLRAKNKQVKAVGRLL